MLAGEQQEQQKELAAPDLLTDDSKQSCMHGADKAAHPPVSPVVWLQTGQFDQIAARIAAAVKLNCGQKAVLHAHSMGGNVMLHMLRLPQFKEWRCVHACLLPAVVAAANSATSE